MSNCPNCKQEVRSFDKKWTYNKFEVQSYECANCKTKFREYLIDGNRVFVLKQSEGPRGKYVKVT